MNLMYTMHGFVVKHVLVILLLEESADKHAERLESGFLDKLVVCLIELHREISHVIYISTNNKIWYVPSCVWQYNADESILLMLDHRLVVFLWRQKCLTHLPCLVLPRL